MDVNNCASIPSIRIALIVFDSAALPLFLILSMLLVGSRGHYEMCILDQFLTEGHCLRVDVTTILSYISFIGSRVLYLSQIFFHFLMHKVSFSMRVLAVFSVFSFYPSFRFYS